MFQKVKEPHWQKVNPESSHEIFILPKKSWYENLVIDLISFLKWQDIIFRAMCA